MKTKTIDVVITTYNFLNELFLLTNTCPILLTDYKLKPYKAKILKYSLELKNLNILENINEKEILWIGNNIPPTIELAYNFHCAIMKNSKTFSDIKNVIENPENYSISELREAIELNSLYENETNKGFVNNQEEGGLADNISLTEENKEIINLINNSDYTIAQMLRNKYAPDVELDTYKARIKKRVQRLRKKSLDLLENVQETKEIEFPFTEEPITITMFSKEYKELNEKFLKLEKEHQELNTKYLFSVEEKKLLEKSIEKNKNITDNSGGNNNEMFESMGIIVKLLDLITKDTCKLDKLEPLQGSFRKVIGMLTTIQMNSVQQSRILYSILMDMQLDFNGTNIHEGISNRKQNIENALRISDELIKHNDSVAHYLYNGKNNN